METLIGRIYSVSGSLRWPGGWLSCSLLLLLNIDTIGMFSKQVQSLVLCTTRDHVIICCLGRIGSRLIKEFSKKYTIVVIEQDEQNKVLERFRHSGVSIVLGNAKERNVLKKACIEMAKYLIVALGNDNVKAEVIIQTQCLVESRKGEPLICFSGILSSSLCSYSSSDLFFIKLSYREHVYAIKKPL